MWASRALRMAAMTRLASDPATLAPAADANQMKLVKSEFNPSEALVIGDVDVADFDGSTAIAVPVGTQPSGFEPGTDDSSIDITPPAGGFRWETTGLTNLPQTIHGYILTNLAGTVILASGLFDTPRVLTDVNQVVDGLDTTLLLPKDSISS